MKHITAVPVTIPIMQHFHVRFHDYVHGRISFIRTVEAPSISAACALARAGIVMPNYVIASFVTAVQGEGEGSHNHTDPPQWSTFPPDTQPEPPMLKVPLSDPEIRELIGSSPEEAYSEGDGHGYLSSDRPDEVTVEELISAIARYPHLMTDPGSLREDIGRCETFGNLLRHQLLSTAFNDPSLCEVVRHLSRISGVPACDVWHDLRADAWSVTPSGVASAYTPAPSNTPLSTRQDYATLDGVEGPKRPTDQDLDQEDHH